MGVFPIVSDIPGNRNWIENLKNGLLVSGTDPDEVADAILKAGRDVELRRLAEKTNRHFVETQGSLYDNVFLIGAELVKLCIPAQQRKGTAIQKKAKRSKNHNGKTLASSADVHDFMVVPRKPKLSDHNH